MTLLEELKETTKINKEKIEKHREEIFSDKYQIQIQSMKDYAKNGLNYCEFYYYNCNSDLIHVDYDFVYYLLSKGFKLFLGKRGCVFDIEEAEQLSFKDFKLLTEAETYVLCNQIAISWE